MIVAGGKWDEVRESLHHEGIAVMHKLGDPVGEGDDLSHGAILSRSHSAHSCPRH